MEKRIFTIVYFAFYTMLAQQAFYNFGDIQIHDQGAIGFHMDLINDGNFNQNQGLAGFYNNNEEIIISGDNKPIFHDMIVDVEDDLILDTPVGVTNFQEFVNGRVITPRDIKAIHLDYENDAPYMGEDDERYVDGYASSTGILNFRFPIGDDFRLRPLGIDDFAAINTAEAAYYFEDPNLPNFFDQSFDTENIDVSLFGVSPFEFWDLNGNTETRVTLTWDDNSNIPTLVDDLENLRVVGWDKELQQWVNLGNTAISGDLNNGEISSNVITPDDYEILTFGTSDKLLDGDLQIFTAVSPNGDGDNDTFIIQGLSLFPDNELTIYNRWGVKVYNQKAYHEVQQDANLAFNGISDGRATIVKGAKLPAGTYYYVLKLAGLKDRAGYLYLNR